MILTIHQPNFFPYCGFFQKVQQADRIVLLGHCQFEKNNYQNRFLLDDKWYTLSVNAKTSNIIDKKYVFHEKDWNFIKNKLSHYKLELFDDCISESVFLTNVNIIKRIMTLFQFDVDKVASDYPTDKKSTARLVDICLKNGADKYLSGISGNSYLNLDLFADSGIDVIYQKSDFIDKRSILQYENEHFSFLR